MAILDIRNNQQEEITGIKFDGTDDFLAYESSYLTVFDNEGNDRALCKWEDFDNFIAACHKARELWGPK